MRARGLPSRLVLGLTIFEAPRLSLELLMSDSTPTSNEQQRREAGRLPTEQNPEIRQHLTHVPLNEGSMDPEEVRRAVSQAMDQAKASAEAVADYAQRQPLKALAAAVLIGIVIGRILW